MLIIDPYHEGERAAQAMTGESIIAARVGRSVHDAIAPVAREFLKQQTMLVCGAVDAYNRPWASIVFGPPGFASSLDGTQVILTLTDIHSHPDDPVLANIGIGVPLGILAIDLSTRRRLRINGTVKHIHDNHVELSVTECYPNCSKYIQQRRSSPVDWSQREVHGEATHGTSLDSIAMRTITKSDTLFITSSHASRGMDTSHRGGDKGFVEILDGRLLRIPDFSGNSMYNTVGNLLINPKSGLVIPDFEKRILLHITGTVAILWEVAQGNNKPTCTGRYLYFMIEEWFYYPQAILSAYHAPGLDNTGSVANK